MLFLFLIYTYNQHNKDKNTACSNIVACCIPFAWVHIYGMFGKIQVLCEPYALVASSKMKTQGWRAKT